MLIPRYIRLSSSEAYVLTVSIALSTVTPNYYTIGNSTSRLFLNWPLRLAVTLYECCIIELS